MGEDPRRWPPSYGDLEGLSRLIDAIAYDREAPCRLWTTAVRADPALCQGDILAFDSAMPVLDIGDKGGRIEIFGQGERSHWMVIGNTCDLAREDESTTQLVPVYSTEGLTAGALQGLRRFESYRRFYLDTWPGGPSTAQVADLMWPATITQAAARGAKTVATMERPGWVLLNACLVRFLGRDDGRNDPA